MLMTCAIRDGAERRIWGRLSQMKHDVRARHGNLRSVKFGILGCMAERLKDKLLEFGGGDGEKGKKTNVHLVCGPDAYRDLPRLLAQLDEKSENRAINVMLSADETYADIMPVRWNPESKMAFVSIMRGCDNMCSYCIVPFTRGRERSRDWRSIVEECKVLEEQHGIKQITLLGQNVNRYSWNS